MKELRLERVMNGWYLWYMKGPNVCKEVFIDAGALAERLEHIVGYEMEAPE